MEWVCRQHDEKRSATTRPTSGGEERVASDYTLPPEENSMRNGLEELDLEALVLEAYEIMKAHIEAEERSSMESGTRGSEDAEEDASLHMEDGAYVEAERERNIDTTGEGVERATLLTCGERTTEDKVGDGEVVIADLREHESVQTRWSGTSSEEASVVPVLAA